MVTFDRQLRDQLRDFRNELGLEYRVEPTSGAGRWAPRASAAWPPDRVRRLAEKLRLSAKERRALWDLLGS